MADPITLGEAINALVATRRDLRGFRHVTALPPWPPGAVPRTREGMIRAAWGPFPVTDGGDDDRPEAPPDATAVRDALYRFRWEWDRHPVAGAMDRPGDALPGDDLGAVLSPRWTPDRAAWLTPEDLADLDTLTGPPPYVAAVLTASAYTARQERDRLPAVADRSNTTDRRRLRRQVNAYAVHYAAAMDRLPDAFASWLPDALAVIERAQKPSVPAVPTVPAVMRAQVRPAPA